MKTREVIREVIAIGVLLFTIIVAIISAYSSFAYFENAGKKLRKSSVTLKEKAAKDASPNHEIDNFDSSSDYSYTFGWTECVAQTDQRLNASTCENYTVTQVEGKYFAVTEKYNCKLAWSESYFTFLLFTPNGGHYDFQIAPWDMSGGFAEIASTFDKDSWIYEWEDVVNDDALLNKDADYIAKTLTAIADELAEADAEPDLGLVSLGFLRWSALIHQVDNAKLSADIAALVAAKS